MIAASKYFHAIAAGTLLLIVNTVHDQFVYPLVTIKYFAYPDATFALRCAGIAWKAFVKYRAVSS
jgi:hypothetical protein